LHEQEGGIPIPRPLGAHWVERYSMQGARRGVDVHQNPALEACWLVFNPYIEDFY